MTEKLGVYVHSIFKHTSLMMAGNVIMGWIENILTQTLLIKLQRASHSGGAVKNKYLQDSKRI